MIRGIFFIIVIFRIILFREIEENLELKIQWRGPRSGKNDKWNTQLEREPDKYLFELREVGWMCIDLIVWMFDCMDG